MSNKPKGTVGAECFTPGCTNTATRIPTSVPGRYRDFTSRYRCEECWEYLSVAEGLPPTDRYGYVEAAVPAVQAWDEHVRTVLELDKPALRAVAIAAPDTEIWRAVGSKVGHSRVMPIGLCRDAACISPPPEPDLPALTTRELVALFDRFTESQTTASEILTVLEVLEVNTLSESQEYTFHHLANEYGTRAMNYIRDNHGDHDGAMSDPGSLVIDTAIHAAEQWHALGLQRGYIADNYLYAVARAAVAALTWSYIELGHVETRSRLADLHEIHNP